MIMAITPSLNASNLPLSMKKLLYKFVKVYYNVVQRKNKKA